MAAHDPPASGHPKASMQKSSGLEHIHSTVALNLQVLPIDAAWLRPVSMPLGLLRLELLHVELALPRA